MAGTEPHTWRADLMDNITFVGLDVHKATVCVALAESGMSLRGLYRVAALRRAYSQPVADSFVGCCGSSEPVKLRISANAVLVSTV
jgi:hypothetical protein